MFGAAFDPALHRSKCFTSGACRPARAGPRLPVLIGYGDAPRGRRGFVSDALACRAAGIDLQPFAGRRMAIAYLG